jgi:hypothetical protein
MCDVEAHGIVAGPWVSVQFAMMGFQEDEPDRFSVV